VAESARLAALKYLCDYLETEVSVANGYNYDLVDAVFRGRMEFGEDDPLPRISVLEGLNADREPVTAGTGSHTQKDNWIILLQGQVPDDPENPTDPAHNCMADVKAAIGKLRKAMSELDGRFTGTPWQVITDLGIEPGTVRPPDQLSNKAFFWIRVVLKIVEEMDDPYWRP